VECAFFPSSTDSFHDFFQFFLALLSLSFMDLTGSLWQSGALVGKAAGLFMSTGTGGQETIGLMTVTFSAHHSMVFVPLGDVELKV
jgi:multimeric flavodoxin WrbA